MNKSSNEGGKWTQNKPSQPGWYWVLKLESENGEARIMEFEQSAYPMGGRLIQPVGGPWSTEGWQWFAGPIECPEGSPTA